MGRVAQDLLIGYAEGLWASLPTLLALLTLAFAGSWLLLSSRGDRLRSLNSPALEWVVLLLALAGGLMRVLSEASIFDDAYISFRYVQNLVDGHGLVFNPGERVEGYTNFAWVMLIALGHVLTGVEIPLVGLVLSVACWIGNIAVVFVLSRRLRRALAPGLYLPFAVPLVAVQSTFVEFGTSGMETGFCSLMVGCGLYFLLIRSAPRHALAAGTLLILATLGRPDHGLMFAAGGLSLLWLNRRELWAARSQGWTALRRAGAGDLLAFSLPFLAYLIYLGWKLSYYGELLPNTYYAKSADLWWPAQGALYTLIFLLQSHMIFFVPLFFIWLKWPASHETARRFKAFVGPAVLIFGAYVVKVGGDFMHGRFFVTLVPLILLSMEQLLLQIYLQARAHGTSPMWRRRLYAVAALVICSAGGLELFRTREILGGVSREKHFYPLLEWSPVVIDHDNYPTGKILGKLADAGVEPLIACKSTGMIGFYSKLPLIDLLGLTDSRIARQPLTRRKRPGHEKFAAPAYIEERDPLLISYWRAYTDAEHAAISKVTVGASERSWTLRAYPVDLIEKMRRLAPEIVIPDMRSWTDQLIDRLGIELPSSAQEVARAEKDIDFVRDYYLEHNHDPERKARIDAISRALSEARSASGNE